MRFQLRFMPLGLLPFATAFVLAHPAYGVIITARAEGQVSGNPQVDAQGPATSGALLASVRFPAAFQITCHDTAFAAAAINDSGVSAVVADGLFPGHTGDFLRAETNWSAAVTNTNSQAYEYIYQFFITPPRLTLADRDDDDVQGTVGGGGPAHASYEVVVELNSIPLFRSYAEASGTWANHTLVEEGTDLGGTFFSDPGHHTFGYAFAAHHGTLSLGSYAPGEGFTLLAKLVARVSSSAEQRGGRAEVGDPLELGGEPGIRFQFLLSIPIAVEPRTWSGLKAMYR